MGRYKKISKSKLKIILSKHEKWLCNEPDGEKANLKSADLESANLESANLKYADLEYANLKYANLKSAILDFSYFPLWCGSFNIKTDDRLIMQLICHLTRLDTRNCSKTGKDAVKAVWKWRNKFCEYRTDVMKV